MWYIEYSCRFFCLEQLLLSISVSNLFVKSECPLFDTFFNSGNNAWLKYQCSRHRNYYYKSTCNDLQQYIYIWVTHCGRYEETYTNLLQKFKNSFRCRTNSTLSTDDILKNKADEFYFKITYQKQISQSDKTENLNAFLNRSIFLPLPLAEIDDIEWSVANIRRSSSRANHPAPCSKGHACESHKLLKLLYVQL